LAEERRIRFISEYPWLGEALVRRRPVLLPKTLYLWAATWVRDVGAVMRSREMMVGMAATATYYALIMGLIRLFPAIAKGPIARRLLEGLIGRVPEL